MLASLRAGLLKLRLRPAVWVLALVLIGVVVTLNYGISWFFLTHPPPNANFGGVDPARLKLALYPANFVRQGVSSFTGIGGSIALILGVLVYGSEYGWGTLKTVLTQQPGRLVIFAGTAAALLLVMLVIVALVFVAAGASAAAVVSLDGKTSDWPQPMTIAKGLAAALLIMALYASFGMALSILFRQSALAIGLGLAYSLVIENIIFGLFGQSQALREFEKPFPGANATALVQAFGRLDLGPARSLPPLVSGGQAVLVLVLYLTLFLAVTAVVLRQRDVS